MQRFLILFLCSLFCFINQVSAQTPESITVPFLVQPVKPKPGSIEAMCNNAGTFQFGQFIGQSNDTDITAPSDTIILCLGDSLFINHNGDADLSGDPIPATPAGVGWAFYECLPTTMGNDLATILADACIWPGSTTGLFVATGTDPAGDIWFSNSQAIHSNAALHASTGTLNQPFLVHFAPITLDIFATKGYENTVGPPGPCVNVNTSAAFKVLYLNAIVATSISSNAGNDCLGRFSVSGGYPEWNPLATYTIDISLDSDPTVKGVLQLPPSQLLNNASITFSVPQAGLYNVTIEDGKSCGLTFQVNMQTCNASDNVVISLPTISSPPATQICIPITVDNFTVITSNFSVEWDPTILTYNSVSDINPAIAMFFAPNQNLNLTQTNNGKLGSLIFNNQNLGAIISIPDGDTLFSICYNVVGMLDSCTTLNFTSDPAFVNHEGAAGIPLATTVENGNFCVGFLPLEVDFTIIDTVCTGSVSALVLQVEIVSGEAPFEVTWEELPSGPTTLDIIPNVGGTLDITGLTSGSYSVCVTDGNGFGEKICDTIDVNLPNIGVNLDFVTLPTCFGDTDGVIEANVFLGSTPVNNPGPPVYAFTWSPGGVPSPNGALQTGVGAGQYAVTVTDVASGCTAVASGQLGQPAELDASAINIVPASCTGIANGSISYTVEDGTPFPGNQYQFQWFALINNVEVPLTNGTANPITLNGLQPGTYRLEVEDANGCKLSDELEVTAEKVVTLNITNATNTMCFGDSTGTATVTVIETPATANPNYLFFWSPMFTQTGTNVSSTMSNMPAGSYNVLAQDMDGCGDTITVVIGSPTPVNTFTINVIQPSCPLPSGGAITAGSTGGTGGPNGYTYVWDSGEATASISGKPEGTYCVTATDVNGCIDTLCVDLILPSPPAFNNPIITPVNCGDDGCIEVVAPSATLYEWTDTSGAVIGSTAKICDLIGGTYFIEITDAGLCTARDTFTLTGVDALSLTDTTFSQPSCFSYTDGSIGITVAGGNPPYTTYNWSVTPAQNTPLLNGVAAGNYAFTVTDSKGCTFIDTLTLLQPPPILATFSNINSTTCSNSCDGTSTISVTPTDNYSFTWDDGAIDSVRTDLCPGIRSVTITDTKNCFRIDQINIDSAAPIVTLLMADSVSCAGGNDGTITLAQPTGGNGNPFTYQWAGVGFSSTDQNVNGLEAGVYNVTVTDKSMCTAVFTQELFEPAPIVLTLDIAPTNDPSCFGGSDGAIGVLIAGGNGGPYQYDWTDANGDQVGSTQVVTNIPSGTFDLVLTDSEGCTGTFTHVLIDPPPVVGSFIALEPILCNGDEVDFIIDNISGGSGGPYAYSIDFGVALDPGFVSSIGGGFHEITYFDAKECAITDTIEIAEPAPIVVSFDPAVIEIELGDSAKLSPIVTGAVVDTFYWSPAEFLNDPGSFNPYATSFESETYTITVLDENNCMGTGSIVVNIDPNRNVYIPNAVSPGNPSGLNDFFNVYVGRGVELVNYMQVYDRWGELMYTREKFYPDNDNLAEGWDGKFKGRYVNPGVYVYVVEVKFLDGRVLTYRGDVSIVR